MVNEQTTKILNAAQTSRDGIAMVTRSGFSIGYITGYIVATIFAITFIPVAFIGFAIGPLAGGAAAVVVLLLHVYGNAYIKSFVIEVLMPIFVNKDIKQEYLAIIEIMGIEKVL